MRHDKLYLNEMQSKGWSRSSDVKREQIFEAKAEARTMRPRPSTIFWVHW